VYGKELLRIKDRHGRDFCYGPTHEEVITDIVRHAIKSYKQMPVNFYQIQTKFRDEIRPRFGLMRGREFIMKDAYSFDINDEAAQISYEKMRVAYNNIFKECGLHYKMVEADSGAIGGNFSHEFMVLAHTGEDEVISCNTCDYAANLEKAIAAKSTDTISNTSAKYEAKETPKVHTVEDVSTFLNIPVKSIIKTIIVCIDDEKYAAILVQGDHEANLVKLKNFLGASTIELAAPEAIFKVTGSPVGFSGPVGLNLPIYADFALEGISGAVVGGNQKDLHLMGVNAGRDFTPTAYGDFRNAMVGDICQCGGTYEIARGIEVGHIFKLGQKYSEAMGAKFLDENGKQKIITMGCYGIGIGRTAAAAIEQNHDESGIAFPVEIAPFEVVVVPLNSNEPEVMQLAESIYSGLLARGVDVIIDDRNERAGAKLIDADLIGYPLRIAVGKKSIAEGQVEVTIRKTKETTAVAKDNAVDFVINTLKRK
jgi:prolyl-tRNA synthetase